MDWLQKVLPRRLKEKLERKMKESSHAGHLLNRRQGLHIVRRTLRSWGVDNEVDEFKIFNEIKPEG